AGLGHFVIEIVALAGALAHAGKHREATVLRRDVADELLDDDRFAYASAAERADLATAQDGRDQVNDLDARLEDAGLGLLVFQRRRRAVNRVRLLGVDRALL